MCFGRKYTPFDRSLAGEILDIVHKKAIEESKEILSGETEMMNSMYRVMFIMYALFTLL